MKTLEKFLNAFNMMCGDMEDPNNRFKSWEHCFKVFSAARKANVVDYDYLSLHLAFYLASFGMYRGSSFLLQKDYKVHIPVVKEILNSKYDTLLSIACSELKKEENLDLLFELKGWINDHYKKVKNIIPKNANKQETSSTLITKILLGTLGCVPAYDQFLQTGLKSENVAPSRFGKNSIKSLCEYYEKHGEELEALRGSINNTNVEYTQMKLLDMTFWKIGFEIEKFKKKHRMEKKF